MGKMKMGAGDGTPTKQNTIEVIKEVPVYIETIVEKPVVQEKEVDLSPLKRDIQIIDEKLNDLYDDQQKQLDDYVKMSNKNKDRYETHSNTLIDLRNRVIKNKKTINSMQEYVIDKDKKYSIVFNLIGIITVINVIGLILLVYTK